MLKPSTNTAFGSLNDQNEILDNDSQQAFDQIWKLGKLGHDTGFNVPVNDLGVARFTAKMNTINRDARRKKNGFHSHSARSILWAS